MKTAKLIIQQALILSLLGGLLGCQKEELAVLDADKKLNYQVTIGTHIPKGHLRVSDESKSLETNANGSVRIRKPNGDTEILKNQKVSVTFAGNYTVRGNAGVYSRDFEQISSIKTTWDGDFVTDVTFWAKNAGEFIQSIDRLDILFSTSIDGKIYSKRFTYSSQTLWDIALGLYDLFGDLALVEVWSEIGQVNKYNNQLYRVFDIGSDITLEP